MLSHLLCRLFVKIVGGFVVPSILQAAQYGEYPVSVLVKINGALIVTALVPVPAISIDGVVGATSLFALNRIEWAVLVHKFKPPPCPLKI